jgi:hypothetical protein
VDRFSTQAHSSKYQLRSEPDLAFPAGSSPSPCQIQRRGDNPEGCGIGDISAWIIKMRRVGHAKHLHPELKRHRLGNVEVPKDAAIQVEETRSPDDISARSPKAYF